MKVVFGGKRKVWRKRERGHSDVSDGMVVVRGGCAKRQDSGQKVEPDCYSPMVEQVAVHVH